MFDNPYLLHHLVEAKEARYRREAELACLSLARFTERLAGWLRRWQERLEESRPSAILGYPERAN